MQGRRVACDGPDICPFERNPGMTRPFRFGVVAPLRTDLPTWRDRVRRIADARYSTLLMPDVPQWQPAPGPTLAHAAALANIDERAELRKRRWCRRGVREAPRGVFPQAGAIGVRLDQAFERAKCRQ